LCDGCFEKVGGQLGDQQKKYEMEIGRLAKKASKMSRSDEEHIKNAPVAEAIRIVARKRAKDGEPGRGMKLGTLYYESGSAIAVYENPNSLRSWSVFGHQHRMVTINFRNKDDVKWFLVKMNELMGAKISKDKHGRYKAYIGSLKKRPK
jgi:hypothetical protein